LVLPPKVARLLFGFRLSLWHLELLAKLDHDGIGWWSVPTIWVNVDPVFKVHSRGDAPQISVTKPQ